jgi:hypothetical protein
MSAPSLPTPPLGFWLVSDVIYKALRSANIVKRAQGIPSSSQYQEGLDNLSQITDEWSARKPFAFATTFKEYTLTPNHQPHLIGPGLVAPDFAAALRPVRIESAELVLTGNGAPPGGVFPNVNNNVDLSLNIRDSAWWAGNSVKGISTSVPTDLYYETDWDSGALWLWPVPNYAYDIRLETWVSVTRFAAITQKFSAPPAYFNALAYTLAKILGVAYDIPAPAELAGLLRDAVKAIQSNNDKSPRCSSADYGTRGRTTRGDFNYYTGLPPTS